MKTVIYLDVLLLVNYVVAAFLLAGCSAVCGARLPVGRLLGAAAVASAASLILLAPQLAVPLQLAYQLATAAGILRIAFAWQGWRAWLRQIFWYFLLNLLLSGTVILASLRGSRLVQTNNLSCYFAVSPALLFACVAGVYFLLRGLAVLFGRPAAGQNGQLVLTLAGGTVTAEALYDTGFQVEDVLTGRPVILLHYPEVRAQLPPGLTAYLDALFRPGGSAPVPPPELHIRFLECRTVAGDTLLPGIPAESFALTHGTGRRAGGRSTVLFTGRPSPDKRCPALFGQQLIQNCRGGNKNDSDRHFFQTKPNEPDRAASAAPGVRQRRGLHRKPADAPGTADARRGKTGFCAAGTRR